MFQNFTQPACHDSNRGSCHNITKGIVPQKLFECSINCPPKRHLIRNFWKRGVIYAVSTADKVYYKDRDYFLWSANLFLIPDERLCSLSSNSNHKGQLAAFLCGPKFNKGIFTGALYLDASYQINWKLIPEWICFHSYLKIAGHLF